MSAATLREVRLYGPLGVRFGRVFHLAVQSPGEAVRALCAVLPGFREAFVGPDGLARYFVFVGRGAKRQTITEEHKDDLVGDDAPIRFVPVIEGAKKQGAGQTILGAVLVVVGMVLNYFSFGTAGNYFIQAGIAMMIGGVVQMLSPQRKPEETKTGDPSYGMDAGAVNTVDTGTPVPIAYGRMIVGSTQVSGGLTTDEIAVWSGGGGGGGGGGFPAQSLPGYMSHSVVDSGAVTVYTDLGVNLE